MERVTELSRVLDVAALDHAAGPIGRTELDVPREWLAHGARVSFVVPSRVACARCEGGGCDGCGRSGALRLDVPDARRCIELTLPARASDGRGSRTAVEAFVVRLVRPLGDEAPLEQLVVLVRAADVATSTCERVDHATPRPASTRSILVAIAVLTALALLVAALLR